MNPALADTLSGAARAAGPAVFDAAGSLLRVAGALAAVLVVIFVLQRLVRRYGNGLVPKDRERIDIVMERRVQPRVSLAIARVAGRNLLVSISPHGVALLTELDPLEKRPPAAPAVLVERARAPQDPAIDEILEAARRVTVEKSRPSAPTFESELKGRLASLKERYPSLWEIEGSARGNP